MAKISDFGLTRASAKQTSTTMMTERIVGTRAYMAPEALRGEITPKSDVFSFGVVRFLLTHYAAATSNVEHNSAVYLILEFFQISDIQVRIELCFMYHLSLSV